MEQPGYWGDELALHLLAVMNKIHYCIITKTKVYYSHPTAFPSPSAVHITLVYLGNSIFRNTTTLSKKCPSPPHIDFNQTLPQDTIPRAACHKNHEEQEQQQESQSESEYAQESSATEDYEYAQESIPKTKGPKHKKHQESRYLRPKNIKFIIKSKQ